MYSIDTTAVAKSTALAAFKTLRMIRPCSLSVIFVLLSTAVEDPGSDDPFPQFRAPQSLGHGVSLVPHGSVTPSFHVGFLWCTRPTSPAGLTEVYVRFKVQQPLADSVET